MFRVVSAIVIAVLTVVDQLSKYAVVSTVKADGPVEFLFGLFQLRYVENTGAAFSSFSDNTTFLTVFTSLVIAACVLVLLTRKIEPLFPNICLVLIVAGGLGNLIDRIHYGYVVDFIEPLFIDFAVFNFADCCITVGVFMLIGYEICEIVKSSKKGAKDD